MEKLKKQHDEIDSTTDETTGIIQETVDSETMPGSEDFDSVFEKKSTNTKVIVEDAENFSNKTNENKFSKETKKKKIGEWINKNPVTSLIIAVIATFLGAQIPKVIVHIRCERIPYVTFEADNTQVFRLSQDIRSALESLSRSSTKFSPVTLEYSVGGARWKVLEINQNIVFGGNRGKLLLRGVCKEGTDGSIIEFATDAQVICTGDIRTLIDYKNYKNTFTGNARFNGLFVDCEQLVVAPDLPMMSLAERCYAAMFSGCTSLKLAPDLPADTMAEMCYSRMFCGCTSLKSAPRLSAMNLAPSCYESMFFDCTSLEKAPSLPAMDLKSRCYKDMFNGCASLDWAPTLPAQNLAERCYEGMFSGCISLHMAPRLPAQSLAERCYAGMFSGCSSLCQITMLATDINERWCLSSWLDDTYPKGTFYKNENSTWDNDGIVPPNWKVVLSRIK